METSELYELPEYRSIHLTRLSRKRVHKNYDYVEKLKLNIITKRIQCLFVEAPDVSNQKQNILVRKVY